MGNKKEKVIEDKREVIMECPLCKAQVRVYNKIMVSGLEPLVEGARFNVVYRQIFFNLVCEKCGVNCLPIGEENKELSHEKK